MMNEKQQGKPADKKKAAEPRLPKIEDFVAMWVKATDDLHADYSAMGLEKELTGEERGWNIFRERTRKTIDSYRYRVNQCMRIQTVRQEYLAFFLQIDARDFNGNFLNKTIYVGIRDKPEFESIERINPDTGERTVVDKMIREIRPLFYLPFSSENLKAIEPYLAENVSLLIKTATGRKYSVSTWDAFCNRSFELLLDVGQHGDKVAQKIVEFKRQLKEGVAQ